MGLHRSSLFLVIGIILFFRVDLCHSGSKIQRTSARILAQRAGAAHFEEKYEKIASSEENRHHIRKRASDEDDFDYEVYQGVVGRPGIDFPILPRIPQTSFSCRTYGNGYFADLETECQVFHICDDGRKISFLCPNGTIFQQTELICDWWFKVNCATSPGYYAESAEILSRGQNRKSRPSRKKVKQNEFYDTDIYSDDRRPSPKIKTEYSLKTHKKPSEGTQQRSNQKRKDSRRVDSDEVPSAENFDFDDSTETIPLTNKKEKLISRVDSNDAEMQDVAESSSFIGGDNGQRRNGYFYNSPNEDKKKDENVSVKSYEKTKKPDRGRQRYNGDANFKLTTKSRVIDSQDSNGEILQDEKSNNSPHKSKVSSDQTPRQFEYRQDRKQQINALNKKSNIVEQSEGKQTIPLTSTNNRPNTYTTPRRLDGTRTTPYYTPTVPTVANKVTQTDTSYNTNNDAIIINTQSQNDDNNSKKFTTNSYHNVQNSSHSTTNYFTNENQKSTEYSYFKNTGTTSPTSFETEFTSTTPEPYRTTVYNGFEKKVFTQFNSKKNQTESIYRNSDNVQNKGYDYSFGRGTQPTIKPQYERNNNQGDSKSTILPSNGRSSTSRGQTTFYGSKFEVQDSKTEKYKDKTTTNTFSQTTTKPLLFGLRNTVPSETSSKNASRIVTTNILSDGTYSKIKPNSNVNELSNQKFSVQSRLNSIGSTFLPTEATIPTSSYYTSSSRTTSYVSQQTTTLRPSSSGPTYLPKSTKAPTTESDVTEHVKEMVKTLNQLKKDLNVDMEVLNKDANKYLGKTRPGLEIPPSSGPETLHSLALYFAGEENNNITSEKEETPFIKNENVIVNGSIGLLSNKTITQYEKLFGIDTTERPSESTISPTFRADFAPDSNDLEAQHSNGPLSNSIGKPESRKIAQVFTNALSAYLEDPDSFRRTLAEIRPTEPSIVENNSVNGKSVTTNRYFNRGTGASYLPTTATTLLPTTITEDTDDLDFSDGTGANQQKSSKNHNIGTTETSHTGLSRTNLNNVDKTPASRLITERGGKAHNDSFQEVITTEQNDIAMEINKGLIISTPASINTLNRQSKRINFTTKNRTNTNSTVESKFQPQLNFNLLPPVATTGTLHPEILPPITDDDEESLQRAHSQSFASASRNELNNEIQKKSSQSYNQVLASTARPGNYITRIPSTTAFPSTGKYSPNPWSSLAYTVFLDPLTINDGLMEEMKTTTASPYTYLPKATVTTTESNPIHVDLKSALANRVGKAYPPNISEELLPPRDGMQKIATKIFGKLNESSADHLMNVMKKAENNQTVRRLILLLIQTCDDDYNKTVEQSRQALLNALIGMDQKLAAEDEIEIIKLKPNRRSKSITSSNAGPNELFLSTTDVPITTYRRNYDLDLTSTTTSSPISWTTSTTESPVSTTTHISSIEETTRFEIRVEEPENMTSTITTPSSTIYQSTPSIIETSTTVIYNTTPSPPLIHSSNLHSTSNQASLRRKAKDLDSLLSQPNSNSDYSSLSSSSSSTNLRHKSSDERALELLKSLYSIASKFGRR